MEFHIVSAIIHFSAPKPKEIPNVGIMRISQSTAEISQFPVSFDIVTYIHGCPFQLQGIKVCIIDADKM